MFRKLTAILMALTLMTGARAQGAYVVASGGAAALVNGDGDVLFRDDAADAILELVPDALYAVGTPGDYGLYDAEGNPLNDDRFEMLEAAGDVLLFRLGGLYGAMDLDGNALIAPEWAQLTYAGEGAFLALRGDLYDDRPDELMSVAPGEAPVATGSATANGLRGFHDGRMAFMQSDGQYGYVDALGRQVIPPQWQYAGDFSEGVAIVSDGSGLGLIDTEGRIVLTPTFPWLRRGEGMLAALTAGGALEVYTVDGSELRCTVEMAAEEAELCGPYVILRDAAAARVYDQSGDCVCETERSTLFFPGLDGQLIAVTGEWGESCQCLLNPDGSAASGMYQRILPLCGGRYAFLSFSSGDYDGARCGLLSSDGQVLLPAEYREILPSGEDRLILVTDNSVAFADPDGSVLREWPIIETAAPSSEAAF